MVTEESIFLSRRAGELARSGRAYRMIDLFAGAGGLTEGFTKRSGHRFVPVWANDFNEYAARTYNANFGEHCTTGDIVDVLGASSTVIPPADVVVGGPPCQGFSLLNRNRDNDPRKQLWRPFLQVVERSGACVFVMENVPQLLGSPEFDQIIEESHRLGFQTVSCKLLAADYGVPQLRWRAFILGCRFADPGEVFPPKKTHYRPNGENGWKLLFCDDYVVQAERWQTVRDAIANLPPDPVGTEIRDVRPPLDLHFGRTPTLLSIKRYETIPEEGADRFDLQARRPDLTPGCWIRKTKGGTDLFGRLWWDKQAFTIRTEFFKPEKGRYLHPVQHRPITHREAARLQSFDDEFHFEGSKIEIAKQIGNAVPPRLAARVADCVYALLVTHDESQRENQT